MKTWVYSWIAYPVLVFVAKIWGGFSGKVRETMRLRSWRHFLSLRFNASQPIEYWIHVASYGEMEYAVPIVEELNKQNKRVLITYYSISAKGPVEALPSQFKNVSMVAPLPHDGLGLMKEFVRLVSEQGVKNLLLMKYELWPGLLWECNGRGIKVYLVDALKPGWFHRKLLHKLDGILAGYSTEVDGVDHPFIRVVGDTRVDRVVERIKNRSGKITETLTTILEALEKPVLLCGSMWPQDNKLLFQTLSLLKKSNRNLPNLIWVPHEIDSSQAKSVSSELKALGYHVVDLDQNDSLSQKKTSSQTNAIAIIVNKKGFLVELYSYADMAYVGGGFGDGIHSVWEPVLAGCKISCGPNNRRSPESFRLASLGLLRIVSHPEEFFSWLTDNSGTKNTGNQDLEVFQEHVGAAARVIEEIRNAD
ncbi:MAG: 3-deoxy-D-manno-octulosonic acid transferase [Bacteriovoracia bacterium]